MTAYQFGQAASVAAGTLDGAPVTGGVHAGTEDGAAIRTDYSDGVVRQFAIMTVVWGIVGMLVGVIIAA